MRVERRVADDRSLAGGERIEAAPRSRGRTSTSSASAVAKACFVLRCELELTMTPMTHTCFTDLAEVLSDGRIRPV
jgi:hypothetical protein